MPSPPDGVVTARNIKTIKDMPGPNYKAPQQQPGKPDKPEISEADRLAGAAVGGAILGASLGGPPGALVGALVGLFLGNNVNESNRKERK